jgi:hypothetical protein
MLKWPQAGDALDRLDADAHLVTVISAGVRQSMDRRADHPTQDAALACDRFGEGRVGLLAVRNAMPNKPKGLYRTNPSRTAKPTR